MSDDPQARWMHDLRNAVNTTTMSVAVARRLLDTGDAARAQSFLADAAAACDRVRVLVNEDPDAPDAAAREPSPGAAASGD